MTSDKRKSKWIIIFLIVCTVLLALYVMMELDHEQVVTAFASMKPIWILILLGCMGLYYVFDALKFMFVTQSFGCPQPF